MDGQQHNATYDFSAPVQPVAVASWRGAFNIPNKNVDISVVAHVSNKACMKVLEVANIMPESLRLEMVSRLDVWPALFRSSPPTEHSMALFFFPDGRDGELLDSVIAEAVYSDFAFRAMIGETELLIFTSVQLPKKLHRLLGKHYLWGVFRGQPAAPSHQSDYHVHIQNPRMKQETYMNSGNHRSFEGCSPVNFSIEQSPSESSAHDDRRENLHGFTWEQHAKPVELAGKNRTESKYFGFVSFDGGVSHYKLNLGVRDQKMHMDTWPNASPEVKGNLPQKVKKSKASKPREMKGLMSEWVNDMDNSKTKKPEADSQVERRGRPLDDAWKHAKALDAARQKTQCKHCGFVSSYGGISRLKAHLGGGCPQMQLQGCSQVPPEVKQVMEQWFTEWSKTSSAAWTKNSAPAKSCKRGNPADEDMWEHAIPLDELGQTTRCKYCGFVSKCGGIDRLKAHLCGGDPAMQLEGCPNVPTTLLRAFMTEKNKKHKKKSKGVSMEQPVSDVFQVNERAAGNSQWYEKRHHVLQETMDEITNSSLKGSLQKLIYNKNAKVQRMHFELQSLENHLASIP
ncbi:uncharacterized protein LOC127257174 isoform X3 [Andrographis paniculata]|uniref:uncharacterized protein LOC127257174 isoform X3 n=1 Tax=Andrographis paniculata TaxID=175694 RepID=UPI0021E9473A|nr:uncharacterized protein LOC127257174 isoform X3 [Andrographis paniculata]